MTRRFIAVLMSVVMLTVSTQSLLASAIHRRSTWDELSRTMQGTYIRMVLPDTTVIKGQVLDVRPDALVVDVRRTSNSRLHPKGPTGIPRSDVSTIELYLRRPPAPGAGPDPGAIGAGLGGVAVSPLLLYLGEADKISGWAALAISIGAAAGGAMLAKRLHDSPSEVVITVVP
jgi:hypothetical protein